MSIKILSLKIKFYLPVCLFVIFVITEIINYETANHKILLYTFMRTRLNKKKKYVAF